MSYKWYNNGIKAIKVKPEDSIPEGFEPGRIKTGKPAWNKGLTKATDSRVAAYSKPGKNKGKTPWNKGLTKETSTSLQIVSNKVKKAREENPRSAWNKGVPMKQSSKDKVSNANRGKTAWNKGLTKETSESLMRTSLALMNHPYNLTPEQIIEAKKKEYATKRKNKTFNSSKPEDKLYEELVTRYGKDDVVRQYIDRERYPFPCDFYIKSQDLFIEYNGTFEHGDKPFDPQSATDCEFAEKIRQKAL